MQTNPESKTHAQGAVGAFIAACHVASPETLQAVGAFHIAVCLPIALASASSKGHQLGPAAAKTLLIGGLAAAQVMFARDENQLRWPSTGGAIDGAGALKGEVKGGEKQSKEAGAGGDVGGEVRAVDPRPLNHTASTLESDSLDSCTIKTPNLPTLDPGPQAL